MPPKSKFGLQCRGDKTYVTNDMYRLILNIPQCVFHPPVLFPCSKIGLANRYASGRNDADAALKSAAGIPETLTLTPPQFGLCLGAGRQARHPLNYVDKRSFFDAYGAFAPISHILAQHS